MKKMNACPASAANNRQAALLELQQLSFSLVDLNLFLDTHPDNQRLQPAVSTILGSQSQF